MAALHNDAFKRDAVCIALTSGLSRRQVASDLGVGLSTIGKWVGAVSDIAKVRTQDAELVRENERLRKNEPHSSGFSRITKQAGELFSRRMKGSTKTPAIVFATYAGPDRQRTE